MEINMKVSQKIKNRTTIWTTSSYFQVFIWKKQKVKKNIYAPPWLLLSTGKKWQQLTCQLMSEWIKKMWYIYNGKLLSHKKKKKKKERKIDKTDSTKRKVFQEGEQKDRLVAFLYHLTFSQGWIKRPRSQNLECKGLFIFSDCICVVDIP